MYWISFDENHVIIHQRNLDYQYESDQIIIKKSIVFNLIQPDECDFIILNQDFSKILYYYQHQLYIYDIEFMSCEISHNHFNCHSLHNYFMCHFPTFSIICDRDDCSVFKLNLFNSKHSIINGHHNYLIQENNKIVQLFHFQQNQYKIILLK